MNLLKRAFVVKFAHRRGDVPPLSVQNLQQSPTPPALGSRDGSPRSVSSSPRGRRGQSFAVSPRSTRNLRGDASPRLNILENLASEGRPHADTEAEEHMPQVEENENQEEILNR